MVILLLEDRIYCIDSLLDRINKSFPKTSIVKVNRRNRFDCSKIIKSSPLLTTGWAIICNNSLSLESSLSFCENDNNLTIIHIKPSDKSSAILFLSERGIKFSVVDNVNLKKENLVEFCKSELGLSSKDSVTLCNRCNNYLPYVTESVSLLKTLGREVTRSDVLKFIVKRTNFTVHSFFLHFIKFKVQDSSLVATYLYDFRFAFSYLKKSLLEYLDDSILIYSHMESGYVGSDNYVSYDFGRELKMSAYVLKNIILNVHSVISLEMLLLSRINIQKCNSIYELLYYI